MMNTAKSDISFYMSVHKDDPDQPDWHMLQTELKQWIEKSGFKVYLVSTRATSDHKIIEMAGTK